LYYICLGIDNCTIFVYVNNERSRTSLIQKRVCLVYNDEIESRTKLNHRRIREYHKLQKHR